MTAVQIEKLGTYIVEKIIKDNLVKIDVSSDNVISELKQRLATEVEARLCVSPEGLTFDYLVEATISQVDINKYINVN